MPDLIYEKRDRYAIFTMNRPERLNALGGTMDAELNEALLDFNADPQMRAGIVTGTGRAFSAGADLKETWYYWRVAVFSPRGGQPVALSREDWQFKFTAPPPSPPPQVGTPAPTPS